MLLGSIEGGGTKFVCGIGTSDGKVLDRISFPTTSPKETLDRAIDYFRENKVRALGIGTFGPIVVNSSAENYGSVADTPKEGWSGYSILNHIKPHLNIPIGFDTDVNAAALGEATWGAARGLANCLYITVGTGIGAGAVIQGNPLHGLTHPEMGHIKVRRHPEDEYEGHCPFHKDCLEGMAAGPALEKRWGKKANELDSDHIAWKWESYYIAQALVHYILILSPQKIILGGGVMNQTHLFKQIREFVLHELNGYVQHPVIQSDISDYIVPPGLQANAGLCGGLGLAIKALQSTNA